MDVRTENRSFAGLASQRKSDGRVRLDGISTMFFERGILVDYRTIYSWVQDLHQRWRSGFAGTGSGQSHGNRGEWMRLTSR